MDCLTNKITNSNRVLIIWKMYFFCGPHCSIVLYFIKMHENIAIIG